MANKDYYGILGVAEDASADTIKSTYRKLAVKYHPDKNAGDKKAEEKFKEISEAYYVLGDAKRKEEFDLARKHGFSGGHQYSGAQDFDFSQFMHAFRQNPGGRHQGFGVFDDILGDLFGGARGRSGGGQQFYYSSGGQGGNDEYDTAPEKVNTDIETEVSIPKAKVAQGAKVTLKLKSGKSLSVSVPKNIRDGQKLRVAGQGKECPCCDKKGDLLVKINLK